MKMGLLINLKKQEAIAFAKDLCDWAENEAHFKFFLPVRDASALHKDGLPDEIWLKTVDLSIVVGGDGTFLEASRFVVDSNIVLFGINLGHLGFLATGRPENAREEILQIYSGDYTVSRRRFLEGTLISNGQSEEFFALNDLVLSKGVLAKLISISVEVYEKPMCDFRADGLIVSSPTGSTAYALSAGGPIVPPHVPCMILAPICAHTLYSRPIILGPEDRLSLIPRTEGSEIYLTIDGQEAHSIQTESRLDVILSKRKYVDVISLRQLGYFELLHQKMMWGFNPVSPGVKYHA